MISSTVFPCVLNIGSRGLDKIVELTMKLDADSVNNRVDNTKG